MPGETFTSTTKNSGEYYHHPMSALKGLGQSTFGKGIATSCLDRYLDLL
jgi:hypothetical protein